jgi:hypothetical protein
VRNDRIMRALFLQSACNVLIEREDSWGNLSLRPGFALPPSFGQVPNYFMTCRVAPRRSEFGPEHQSDQFFPFHSKCFPILEEPLLVQSWIHPKILRR